MNKLKRIGKSRRVCDGYTMRELELRLGEDHDIHRIREKDLLNFIRNHPREINLGKVDQTWFLDLVLLRGHEVPEKKLVHDTDRDESDAAT